MSAALSHEDLVAGAFNEAMSAQLKRLEQQLSEGEAILKAVKEEMEQATEGHAAAVADLEAKLEAAEADAAALREELITKTMVGETAPCAAP